MRKNYVLKIQKLLSAFIFNIVKVEHWYEGNINYCDLRNAAYKFLSFK